MSPEPRTWRRRGKGRSPELIGRRFSDNATPRTDKPRISSTPGARGMKKGVRSHPLRAGRIGRGERTARRPRFRSRAAHAVDVFTEEPATAHPCSVSPKRGCTPIRGRHQRGAGKRRGRSPSKSRIPSARGDFQRVQLPPITGRRRALRLLELAEKLDRSAGQLNRRPAIAKGELSYEGGSPA